MYIKSIELKDFRNYEGLFLQFNKNVNLFLGKNAQGKTNLLEAIYITSLGKSFRTNHDIEMINFNNDRAMVKVETIKDNYEGSVEITLDKNSKKYVKVNGLKINKTSELLENVYTVIFSPEDLKIVKDEPEKRRKFIDRELCQIKPSYFNNLISYRKVLIQRNAYLKEIKVDPNVLDVWDIELSKYGANIIHQRKNFIDELNKISRDIHFKITNEKENLKISYDPNIEYVDDIEEQKNKIYAALRAGFDRDLKNRTTTIGPHKDDLQFEIDGINVRNYGSQGQQRTTALSLKMAELNIIKKETGEDAILLLDDVMSELDIERQEYLVKTLSKAQLFITTTEIPDYLTKKFGDFSAFYVKNGKIENF